MTEVRKMKVRVDAALKRLDPKAIVLTNFFDDASERMFVTIVKGPRKISVTLRGCDFTNGADKINRAIEEGLQRLRQTPIG